jgi:hypothetical protein
MPDRYDIGKQNQGFHTLVSEVSVLQFDRSVAEIKKLRESRATEKEILAEIELRFRGFDELTRKKIYQLSLDLVPRDDFGPEDVQERADLNESTCELRVDGLESRLQGGSIIYFERKRWVMTRRSGDSLTLKLF